MTISDLELCQISTANIAAVENFYPTKISVHHHQLRHFISTAEQGRIYYVNNFDVFVLDLKTNQSTLLATIPFEARCLAADHGWVCIGGENNGDCAFIRIEQEDGTPTCFGHDLNVDVLGGEIVNSMSIYIMQNEYGEGEPVVLISNNDMTVKVYSLAQREVLAIFEHKVPINFASMSPDSTIIAVIGDSDMVYFYKRHNVGRSRGKSPDYEWLALATPVIPTGDVDYPDHGFAITFSPSGHLCAASAQGGAISVFDMRLLGDEAYSAEDAIICTFRSSRPDACGFVRAMAFSPEPWDLLAWAEDHGRIGIADTRQMFVRRQILELDKQAANTVHIEDATPAEYRGLGVKEKLKEQHLARLRSGRGLRGSREGQAETREDLIERRQTRQELLSYHHGLDLDARERSVLEALETTMDDVERYTSPYSVNYTSSPRFRPSSGAAEANRQYDVQLLNPGSRQGSRIYQPRRRTSVILSESTQNRHLATPEATRARISASPGRMTDDEEAPIMSTNDLTPSRGSTSQPLPDNIPPSDPWHVIQSALETARQGEGLPSSSTQSRPATLVQIEAALEAERRLGDQLERQLADERQLSNLLRRQLETQERLLQSQQRELQAEREAGARLEPSLERELQRELESEQQFGEQRSQELETEIRLGTNRARRLESERARLLSVASDSAAETSAQTSTLETTNVRQETPSQATILERNETFRRQRMAHIENLERQVRRAESRVASASHDIEALESAIQHGASGERASRQGEARTRGATGATGNIVIPASVRQRAAVQRAELAMNAERTNTRQSDLARRAAEADMQMVRMIVVSSPRVLDNNGNWVPGSGLRRLLGAGVGEPASMQELLDEVGVGTAGLGWSPDGRSLYAGSEDGVFEFKINMRDRMTFPSVQMR